MGRWLELRGSKASGEIRAPRAKRLTVEQVTKLMAHADQTPGWSAAGRPNWLARNHAQIQGVWLTVFGLESPGVYRCVTHVKTGAEAWWFFSVDVAIPTYKALQRASKADLAELSIGRLNEVHVPVEEG